MNVSDPDVRAALAGEYVLGTMHAAARRRFERMMRDDPTLSAEVERCQEDLFRLIDLLPEEAPPQSVWSRIDASISPTRAARAAERKASWWSSVGLWRTWALASTVAALLLAVWVGQGGQPAVHSPTDFVVVVTDDAGLRASWLVSGSSDATTVRVRAFTPQPLPPGRAFQLWMLPAGETRVRSVGLIPASGDSALTVPKAIAEQLAEAQKLGVSIEAPTGSPTGQPTTTPLYHGTPQKL